MGLTMSQSHPPLSSSVFIKLCSFADAAGLTPDALLEEALASWVEQRCRPMLRDLGAGIGLSSRALLPPDNDRWESLPNVTFKIIYNALRHSLGSLCSARLACRRWALMLAASCTELAPKRPTHGKHCVQRPFRESFPSILELDLTQHPYFGRREEDLDALQGLGLLHSLSFRWWGELSEGSIARLQALESLRECRIILKTSVSKETLQALGGLEVPRLSLAWCLPDPSSPAEDHVQQLLEIPSLANLRLEGSCGYFDESVPTPPLCKKLELLQPLSSLRTLLLARQNVTSEQVSGLSTLLGLQELDLSECFNIGHEALTSLQPLSNLTSLNLAASGYSGPEGDNYLLLLQPLTGLRRLDLSGRVSAVTDMGLQALESMTGLTSLTLTELRRISHHGLASIAKLANLRFLNLELCMVTHGYAALESLREMRALGLSTCAGLTETDLLSLCISMPSLTSIDLSFTGIEHYGCHALGLCEGLRAVSLEGTSVTEEGLMSLCGLSQLTYLNLQTCNNLHLGIAALTPLRHNLTSLATYTCTPLDDIKAHALELLLPGCHVKREPVSFNIHDYFQDG